MKVVESLALRVALRTIPILTIGIKVLDLLMPVGVVASVHYVLPSLLTVLSPREGDPIYLSIIATVLIWIDLFLKPSAIPIPYGLFNRMVGTLVLLWSGVRGLIHYKPLQEGLISAETI
jgi:hypothetical protein